MAAKSRPAQVFISYKAEEYEVADWVRQTLEQNDISCWMAPASIPGGSSYAVEIPQAIRGCQVFVLILSRQSQESKWVPKEIDQAINANKTIMPFMLENCELKDDFNFYLSNVQRYAAYENKARAMEKMLREIRALLDAKEANEADETDEGAEAGTPAAEQKESLGTKPAEAPQTVSEAKTVPETKKIKKKPVGKFGKKKPAAPKNGTSTPRFNAINILKILAGIILAVTALIFVVIQMNKVTIAGTEYKRKDRTVYLSEKELTAEDIKAFTKFKELSSVTLKKCTIQAEDISALLPETVYSLEISECGLSDAQWKTLPLAGSSLTTLRVNGNPEITSLDALMGVSEKLRTLNISDTGIRDISILSSFPELTNFYGDGLGIADLTPLSSCEKLEKLCADRNEIADLAPLTACTRLTSVHVNANHLRSLSGLENALKLEEIEAAENEITDINGLTNATLLSRVDLAENDIEDISLLGKSAATLKNCYLQGNGLESIDVFSTCTGLEYLNLDRTYITSLAPLAVCTQLKGLSAAGNLLTDTAGISGIKGLTYLDLSDNQLTEVKLGMEGENRITLKLAGTEADSPSWPSGASFRWLDLRGCSLNDPSILYSTPAQELVIDYRADLNWNKLKETVGNKCYLIDVPQDQQVAVQEALGSGRAQFVTAEEASGIQDAAPQDVTGYSRMLQEKE